MLASQHSETTKIIVLGTTYSGSGAVYDYLLQRGDGYDPLSGAEYLLPQIPYGLMSLRAAIGLSFHHAVADHAVRNFILVAKKLSHSPSHFRYGKGYGVALPNFLEEVRQLVRDATAAEFPFQLDWKKAEESGIRRVVNLAMARFLKYKSRPNKTWLPISEDKFIGLCQAMHDRLFSSSGSRPPAFTLLNQAGAGWNPLASTDFFSNRKVVLVIRDPRDQFAELKLYKQARNVDEFIKWYKAMQQRISVNHSDLLVVCFESFVLRHESTVLKLCDFAGIEAGVPSAYSAEKSAYNIAKYKELLTYEEITKLEENLGSFLSMGNR